MDRKAQEYGQGLERVGPVVTFLDCWFGYKEEGVGATEWYEGHPCWWGLPGVTETVRIRDLAIGRMGFAVPWAVFVDKDWRFWLNGNYTAHCQPDEKYCMEVARTEDGYFVGVSGCPERTWSHHGSYSDPFVPLPVLNLRARLDDPSPTC